MTALTPKAERLLRELNEEIEKSKKPKCPHNNVQQFTECCLDCGKNIWAED
jgi:hypothetical protein